MVSRRSFLHATLRRPLRYLAQSDAVLDGGALNGNDELGHRAGHRSNAGIPALRYGATGKRALPERAGASADGFAH